MIGLVSPVKKKENEADYSYSLGRQMVAVHMMDTNNYAHLHAIFNIINHQMI